MRGSDKASTPSNFIFSLWKQCRLQICSTISLLLHHMLHNAQRFFLRQLVKDALNDKSSTRAFRIWSTHVLIPPGTQCMP
mmetsp:Transcript_44101/g.66471  ORF Transcript_44101/g.66471 Transcript_44101/m.66471 type:complete len:80 (-) Transcript_44101:140-379(-)